MKNAKPVSIPLAGHMMLSKKICPTAREEKREWSKFYIPPLSEV